MTKRTTILYAMAWAIYVPFSLVMFPYWNTNVVIPTIPLFAIGGWLFGTSKGLMVIIPAIVYHYILLSEIYANILNYYQDRAAGALISIIVVMLAGNFRKHLDGIIDATIKLDTAVAEQNEQLIVTANHLIQHTERTRVERGKELHDGIGQHLTGILLYSEALSEQLSRKDRYSASLAAMLKDEAAQTHNLIRGIARTLFPVKIAETGLVLALKELASCLQTVNSIDISVNETEDLEDMPEWAAIQLFRICQETAIYIMSHSRPDQMALELSCSSNDCCIEIAHNGTPVPLDANEDIDSKLIHYRLLQVSGSLATKASHAMQILRFTMPNPTITEP